MQTLLVMSSDTEYEDDSSESKNWNSWSVLAGYKKLRPWMWMWGMDTPGILP